MFLRLFLSSLALFFYYRCYIVALREEVLLPAQALVLRWQLQKWLKPSQIDLLYPELTTAIRWGYAGLVIQHAKIGSLVLDQEIDRIRVEKIVHWLSVIDYPKHRYESRHGQAIFQQALILLARRVTMMAGLFPDDSDFIQFQSLSKRLTETLSTYTLLQTRSQCKSRIGAGNTTELHKKEFIFQLQKHLYSSAHQADIRRIRFASMRLKNQVLTGPAASLEALRAEERSVQ